MRYIYYHIYDDAGNQLWYKNPSWNSTTETITTSEIVDLTRGTYYFVAKRDGSYSGNYSFRLDFTSANESFAEDNGGTNNAISSASNISLNTTYNGQLAVNDEKDFYRFTLNSTSKVTFTSLANMRYIYYYLYDASEKQLWYKNPSWNSTTEKIEITETLTLNAGTYYLAIKKDGARTGHYNFRLATHIHSYNETVKKATPTSNGKIVLTCSCGVSGGTKTIYSPKQLIISSTSYTYDGKVKTPSVLVKASNGGTVSPSYYIATCTKGRKDVGKYTVKVTFKGNYYTGSLSKTFTILPKTTSISKLSAKSKGFSVKWKRQKTQVTGYQIQYSTSKKFSGKTTKTITKNSTTSTTFTKLKGNKKYYVRIRTYKTVSGTKYYSAWSSVKAVKTKK